MCICDKCKNLMCLTYLFTVVATVLMLIYIYARHKYTKGYIEDAEKRYVVKWTANDFYFCKCTYYSFLGVG